MENLIKCVESDVIIKKISFPVPEGISKNSYSRLNSVEFDINGYKYILEYNNISFNSYCLELKTNQNIKIGCTYINQEHLDVVINYVEKDDYKKRPSITSEKLVYKSNNKVINSTIALSTDKHYLFNNGKYVNKDEVEFRKITKVIQFDVEVRSNYKLIKYDNSTIAKIYNEKEFNEFILKLKYVQAIINKIESLKK